MKKSYIIALAVAALASCSENDTFKQTVSEDNNIPFAFSAYSNKATKADSHNTLQFFYPTFIVDGWKTYDGTNWSKIFNSTVNEYFDTDKNGTKIYKSSLPSAEWGAYSKNPDDSWKAGWYYEGITYWDKFATNYMFCAYAPIEAKDDIECTSAGLITIGSSTDKIDVDPKNLMSTPAQALAYKGFDADYMTATKATVYDGNGSTTYKNESPVSLVFTHELAKFNIKIKLNTNVTTTQNVVVDEVTIKNISGTSYYTSAEDKDNPTNGFVSGWADPVATQGLTYTSKGVGTSEDGYKLNNPVAADPEHSVEAKPAYDDYFIMERLMIPQVIAKTDPACQLAAYDDEACVYVKYTIGSESYTGHWGLANLFDNVAANTTVKILGGNEYTLTITIGPEPIYFSTSVTAWDDNEGSFSF